MTQTYQPNNKKYDNKDILAFIVEYRQKHHGISPSYQEICDALHISSVSVLRFHLIQMKKSKMIYWNRGQARSIVPRE